MTAEAVALARYPPHGRDAHGGPWRSAARHRSRLNHISGHKAGVAGVYNRASYANEKRQALDLWGAHVESLAEGRMSNVVPLRGAILASPLVIRDRPWIGYPRRVAFIRN